MNAYRLVSLLAFIFLMNACNSSKPIAKRNRKENSTQSERKAPSKNKSLQGFIAEWKGTPHVMGGNTKKGVDCSGLVVQIYKQVYQDPFKNRRARDIYLETIPLKKSELIEGDLVFFKINSSHINHIGVYLNNNRFVHVSSKRGVMVSGLEENYFKKYFFAGGRKK